MQAKGTGRFTPQHLWPVIIIKGGKMIKKMDKPRVFVVKSIEELKQLPGGIVPLEVDLAEAAKRLNTDGRALLREGIRANGVNVDEFYASIKACGMRPIFQGMGLRDKFVYEKPLEEMTEKERADAEERFHEAVFKCVVGRICDPDIALEEFSLMKTLNDKQLDDFEKASSTAAYLAAKFENKTDVAQRSSLLAESMSSFISSSIPKDPFGKNGKWIFVELVSLNLYQEGKDFKLDADFCRLTLEAMGFNAKEAFAWLSAFRTKGAV